jgi:hypothetical protein
MRVTIARDGHGQLVIDDAEELAAMFFGEDGSSITPTGFDARAGGDPINRITAADVTAILSTMRVRGARAPWDALPGQGDVAELAAIDPDWDLLRLTDDAWAEVRPAIQGAIERFNPINSFGPAKITKLLALKRPRCVPPCDSYVLDLIGVRVPTEKENRHKRPAAIMRAIDLLRAQGIANLEVLVAIQEQLPQERTLARVLDALLWSFHPASEFSGRGAYSARWRAAP